MRKLYTFGLQQRGLASLLRDLLAQEGIACVVKNEQLFMGMGEIPFVELFPELWVIDDEVLPRAQKLLEQWLVDHSAAERSWICPECGEQLEGQFGACWKCGHERER